MTTSLTVSLINNINSTMMLQSETDEPLNVCKQHPTNNPDDPQHVKQTLKSLIQSRRLAEGKDAITIDSDKHQYDDDLKLTPDELTRQQNRKEQNRRASQKCRKNKRHHLQTLQEEKEELLLKKCQLEAKYRKLNSEKQRLLHTIRSNGQYTCISRENDDVTNSYGTRDAEDNAGQVFMSLRNKTTKKLKHYYIQKYRQDQLSEEASEKHDTNFI